MHDATNPFSRPRRATVWGRTPRRHGGSLHKSRRGFAYPPRQFWTKRRCLSVICKLRLPALRSLRDTLRYKRGECGRSFARYRGIAPLLPHRLGIPEPRTDDYVRKRHHQPLRRTRHRLGSGHLRHGRTSPGSCVQAVLEPDQSERARSSRRSRPWSTTPPRTRPLRFIAGWCTLHVTSLVLAAGPPSVAMLPKHSCLVIIQSVRMIRRRRGDHGTRVWGVIVMFGAQICGGGCLIDRNESSRINRPRLPLPTAPWLR